MESLTVGDLQFEVRRSNRRRTLEIVVDRGGELVFHAPSGVHATVMEDFANEKRFWIYTKLAEKEKLRPTRPSKQYVSGEGFHYLGRTYRLLIVPKQDRDLKLVRGRFRLRRAAQAEGATVFRRWYSDHAVRWLRGRVGEFEERVAGDSVEVRVLDLKNRWASCRSAGVINVHWATIQLPPSVIDYVLVHELVHLREPHHTPEFWTRVERVLPDFALRKQWLAENGAEFVRL